MTMTRGLRWMSAGLTGTFMLVACSGKTVPAGGLQLMLASNLQSPSELDTLNLEIRQETAPGQWGEPLIKRDFLVPAETVLPTTFAVAAGTSDHARIRIVVLGRKGDAALVQREVEIQVPTDRVAALPLVLASSCVGQFRIESGVVRSTCPDPTQSCQPTTGTCGPTMVDSNDLPTYEPGDENTPALIGEISDPANADAGASALDSGETIAKPTFSPPQGTFTSAQDVTISTTTPGAKIYYTTNGSDPAPPGGQEFTGTPLTVIRTTTLRAVAISGFSSAEATAIYTINRPADLTSQVEFAPLAGEYNNAVTVTLSSQTSGATICYTLDGSLPNCTAGACSGASAKYSAPLTVDSSGPPPNNKSRIRAVACSSARSSSDPTETTYTYRMANPTMTPGSGVISQGDPVKFSTATTALGTAIRYSSDGSVPSCTASQSTVVGSEGTVTINDGGTYRAIACNSNYAPSVVISARYCAQATAPCTSQGKTCGVASDGCGGTVMCGLCLPPEGCGFDGSPDRCGPGVSCTPTTTCAAQGAECGKVGDGCGGTLDCPPCPPPKVCGYGGANKCG